MANSTTVVGRAVADAEVAYSNDGKPRLTFRLASDVGFGEKKTTNWYAVTLFGARGEKLSAMITKGKELVVFGEERHREYDAKDGSKRLSIDLVANDITFVGGKAKNDNQETNTYVAPTGTDAAPF